MTDPKPPQAMDEAFDKFIEPYDDGTAPDGMYPPPGIYAFGSVCPARSAFEAGWRAARAAAFEECATIAEEIADEIQSKAGDASDEDDVYGFDVATDYADKIAATIRERAKEEK